MRRRLASPALLERWSARLQEGAADAVRAQKAVLGPLLAAHGVAWSDPPSKLPASLWDDAGWERTVDAVLGPVALEVAAEVAWHVRAHFPPGSTAGIPDGSVIAYARIPQVRALSFGEKLAARLSAPAEGKGLVAAGGNMATISSALDDASSAMADLVGRSGNHMVNAAGIDAAGAVAAATGSSLQQIWQTMEDDRVRDSHDETEGQVRAEGEPFETGDGNLLMYPGDPDGPPEDTENCRCWLEVQGEDWQWRDVTDYPAGGNLDAIQGLLDAAVAETAD